MQDKQLKKQQHRYFLATFVSFAAIFLLLGMIVFNFVQASMYEQVDNNLLRFTDREGLLSNIIEHFHNLGNEMPVPPDEKGQLNSFQEEVVLWSEDGEMLNQNAMGSRLYEFEGLSLDTKKMDTISNITLKNTSGEKLRFRTITVVSPLNDGEVAYIQVLTNTDQIVRSVESFKNILIVCMLGFGVFSILLSYFLSRIFVTPIIRSWRKQQQFVENASHELRTPLTIIQSKLEELFTKPNHTIIEESEKIALSLNEVQRLSRLTSDLLLLARSDSDAVTITKEPVAVNAFLTKNLTPYQEIVEAEGKHFELQLAEEKTLQADPSRIQQLLVILLDNAIKYTEEGDTIAISSGFRNNEWVIKVADTGKGIDLENKSQVFERFYREDASRNRETGGYGIGLSIALWIVEAHAGKITVQDNQPKGTVFEIRLPFK